MNLRPAEKTDATAMAALVDIASHGLASHFWGQMRQEENKFSAIEVGRERAMREEGDFSYRNSWVAETNGEVIALLAGYKQPDDPKELDFDPDDAPNFIVPLLELEKSEPGIWYLNVLAVFAEYRGKGIASKLLAKADELTRECGAPAAGLIVEDDSAAVEIYKHWGYEPRATAPYITFHGSLKTGGNWLMMRKDM